MAWLVEADGRCVPCESDIDIEIVREYIRLLREAILETHRRLDRARGENRRVRYLNELLRRRIRCRQLIH